MVQIHSPRPLFLESTLYITRERHENAKSVWSKTKRSCLNSVGRERSLFFEFMALQRDVRFTGNPILGRLGTRSALWEEKPSSGSSSVSSPRCDPATALIAGNHQRKCLLQRFRAKAKALLSETRANPELIQVDCIRPESAARANGPPSFHDGGYRLLTQSPALVSGTKLRRRQAP
jgi:hypothetical protein